jgi:hypothetical protein
MKERMKERMAAKQAAEGGERPPKRAREADDDEEVEEVEGEAWPASNFVELDDVADGDGESVGGGEAADIIRGSATSDDGLEEEEGSGIRVEVGMRFEVIMEEEGLMGARYAATVLGIRPEGKGGRGEDEAEGGATHALVEYDALYADADDDKESSDGHDGERGGGRTGGEGGGESDGADEPRAARAGETRLQEWVSLSSLRPVPPPPPGGWTRRLVVGDRLDALHEEGWWQVTLKKQVPPMVPPDGKGAVEEEAEATLLVEVDGYQIERTLAASNLRPRAP